MKKRKWTQEKPGRPVITGAPSLINPLGHDIGTIASECMDDLLDRLNTPPAPSCAERMLVLVEQVQQVQAASCDRADGNAFVANLVARLMDLDHGHKQGTTQASDVAEMLESAEDGSALLDAFEYHLDMIEELDQAREDKAPYSESLVTDTWSETHQILAEGEGWRLATVRSNVMVHKVSNRSEPFEDDAAAYRHVSKLASKGSALHTLALQTVTYHASALMHQVERQQHVVLAGSSGIPAMVDFWHPYGVPETVERRTEALRKQFGDELKSVAVSTIREIAVGHEWVLFPRTYLALGCDDKGNVTSAFRIKASCKLSVEANGEAILQELPGSTSSLILIQDPEAMFLAYRKDECSVPLMEAAYSITNKQTGEVTAGVSVKEKVTGDKKTWKTDHRFPDVDKP